jgi:hypothetical protein
MALNLLLKSLKFFFGRSLCCSSMDDGVSMIPHVAGKTPQEGD